MEYDVCGLKKLQETKTIHILTAMHAVIVTSCDHDTLSYAATIPLRQAACCLHGALAHLCEIGESGKSCLELVIVGSLFVVLVLT